MDGFIPHTDWIDGLSTDGTEGFADNVLALVISPMNVGFERLNALIFTFIG